MNIFQKIKSAFSFQLKRHSASSDSSALFLLRGETLDELSLQALSDHIRLYLYLGYRVKTEQLQLQIPTEYIGLLMVWSGGRQEYQEYLSLQSEFVEKKFLVCRRISLSNLPVISVVFGSNHNP